MYRVCLCVLFLGVTRSVVSQANDYPNERWDQDPIVQDIAKELGKFLKEYIEKYCKNSTRWIDTKQSDEYPVYVKPSMHSTEPEEETLVVRQSVIGRLPEDEPSGDRRSAAKGSEDPAEDNDGILLEIEDQPKDSKSVLTADELVLSIAGPEGTRRSSITLPSDLQQVISEYLKQRRRRRKRFKITMVENNQIEVSGGGSSSGLAFRRASESTPSEYTEEDPRYARKFVRIVPNDKLKPKRVFSAGIGIGVLPGDEVVSKPMHLQLGITKKIPGFKSYIPGIKRTASFSPGSLPMLNKFEINGPPRKPFGSFKLSKETKPYDNMYQYKRPKDKFSIQQIPGEYIPGQQDNSPYGFSKLSPQNTPYDMPGSPAQMISPYGPGMELSIGGPNIPYGPDPYIQPYGIPGPGIQFEMPGANSPYGFLQPAQANIPYGTLKLSTKNQPYEQSTPEQIEFKFPRHGNTYDPFDSPQGKIPLSSYSYSPPSPGYYTNTGNSQVPENYKAEQVKLLKLPNVGGPRQIKYDFPGQSIPGQQFDIPGQQFNFPGQSIPGQQFDIPGSKFDIPVHKFGSPEPKFDISVQKFDVPGQQFDIPGSKFDIPVHKFGRPKPKFDISVQKFQVPKPKFDISVQKFDVPGQQFDIPGQKFDIPRQKFEVPGQKFEVPGQKFEMPGGYTPGQANAPLNSFKLSIGNKPYEVPSNNYQFKLPGQKLEIPGQKFEIPGRYTPGQANTPINSFKLSIGNKPYEVPSNNYQLTLPGHKLEIPGANVPLNSFKLSLGNKPYGMPGLSRTGTERPYGPDKTYNQNELPRAQNSNPSQLDLPAFDIKPDSSKYQYSGPGQGYQSIGLHSQPIAGAALQSHTVQVGLHSQPVGVGYNQYSPGALYYQESSPTVAKYQETYSVHQPSYTDGFRRKVQNDTDTSQDEPEDEETNEQDQKDVDDEQPKLQPKHVRDELLRNAMSEIEKDFDKDMKQLQDEQQPVTEQPKEETDVEPMPKDVRDELLRRAMLEIEKDFSEDMKKLQDQQQPVNATEHPEEEREDNKHVQEQTEAPQYYTPTTITYQASSTDVTELAEPMKNLTKSSEEGYVFGISSDASDSDEETALANTYSEYSKANKEHSDEHGHRHNCDDTSEYEYEYDDESAEESTVKTDEKRRTPENVALHLALEKVKEMMAKEKTTTQKTADTNVTEVLAFLEKPQDNATEVRRFGNRPDTFNGSLEHLQPVSSSLEEPTNDTETMDDNLPEQNVNETPNNEAVPLEIGKLFPQGDTPDDGGRITDNMKMYISETISQNGEDRNNEVLEEVLPVNTEQMEYTTTEEQRMSETPLQILSTEIMEAITEPPLQRLSTEVIESVTLPPMQRLSTEDIETITVPPMQRMSTEVIEAITVPPMQRLSTEVIEAVTEPPMQRLSTEVIESVTLPPMQRLSTEVLESVTENIDYTQYTADYTPEDVVTEQVFHSVFTEETYPETQTMLYTDSGYTPTETPTMQYEYSRTETPTMQYEYYTPSTLAPQVFEEYTDSVTTVAYTEFPALTTDEGSTHLETMQSIEPTTDVTVEPPVTIADMGKDIDYVQYYNTEDAGHEVTMEETSTATTNLEYTTLNLLDNPTTATTDLEYTTLNLQDNPTTAYTDLEYTTVNLQDNPTTSSSDLQYTTVNLQDYPTTAYTDLEYTTLNLQDNPTTTSSDLEYTTLNLPDSSTTVQFTTVIYEETPTTEVTEENPEDIDPARRNQQSEDSVENTTTDPTFENALPFLKNKLMTEDYKGDGNYENYILEDVLQKPFVDLTDNEKVTFERMTNLAKHPDNLTLDELPENYRPRNESDDQFLVRGMLNDDTLDNDYLRKGVILLKNYPEKDIDSLKIRTDLKEILRGFKNKPNETTSEEKRMNLVLSLLASHPKELDSVYEAMVKKGGEPDANEQAVIGQWLQILKYNKGVELMYLFNNNGGGSEDDFRVFLLENLLKKAPDALNEEEQQLLDTLVLLYKHNILTRPTEDEEKIIDDDLYKLGILTIKDSPNQENPGLLPHELLEFVFKKPDTELNDREYKIYNYLIKVAKNPAELLQRYYEVMGTVKNDLDEKYIELHNGTIPRSFEEVSAALNDTLPKKRPEELTEHDYYILYLLKYLADNKELIPHLANYEHNMVYNLPLFKYGIIKTANSPNRNNQKLLSVEILKTVLKKPKEQLNNKEKMVYNHLMKVPANFADLMGTYSFIMHGVPANEDDNEHGIKKNKYMVAIIKIPIKSHEENGEVIMNKTIRISMDDYHQTISNLPGESIDNEKAVFIMPEEDGESLNPLDLDDKTKLVHKLEVARESLKVHRAHSSEYAEQIPQYLDEIFPDLVRLLQSGSTQAFNESGEINYDVNNNEPGDNLQQLLGLTILQIRRRKINPTEVDDGELIQYLTTLQRKLMKEIKSEYGTTDFTQEPVKIERRYMDESDDMEDYTQEDSDAGPGGQRRGLMDTPLQIAMQAVAKWFMAQNQNPMQQPTPYRRADPDEQVQQAFQNYGHRRAVMDTPVQLAMNAVAKWYMAQNENPTQAPNSYRRNVPDQDGFPEGEDLQESIPVAQRRSLQDAPLELARNVVRKFVGAENEMEPLASFRRNVPDEHATAADENVLEKEALPKEQGRALMDAPLQLANSLRRNAPIEHSTDLPNEQTTQTAKPSRRYLEDSLEDYLYDDNIEPVGNYRRSNNERRKEETEEDTPENVMPKANRRNDKSPYVTVQIQRKTDRNTKSHENDRVWTIKGLKRRSLEVNQEPDEDDKRVLSAMRRATALDNEGEDNVGRKHRKRRLRRKHRTNPRRRRMRSKPRHPDMVRKFDPELVEPKTPTTFTPEFVPTTPPANAPDATTVLTPSRRQFPLSILSGILPMGGGGAPGGGGFNPLAMLGGLNPFQMLGMRRNKEESTTKQAEPVRVLGQDYVESGVQGRQWRNYNAQNNPNYNGQNNIPNYNAQRNIQTYTDPPAYTTTSVPAQENAEPVPEVGQINYKQQTNIPSTPSTIEPSLEPSLEPSQKNRRSADAASLLRLLNPVDLVRRLNPFISRVEKPAVEITENSTKLEEHVTSQPEEQEDSQTERKKIELEDETNSTNDVESSTKQESNETTEDNLVSSTKNEESVTSENITEEKEYNEAQIELEDEKNKDDTVESSTKQDSNDTTEDDSQEDNITNVQTQDTIELAQEDQQEEDDVMETETDLHSEGNSTQLSSEITTI